jgi:hypothetical protein
MTPFKKAMLFACILFLVIASLKVVPGWMAKVFIVQTIFFFTLAELWMSMGLVNGDSDAKRSGSTLPPLMNSLIMSGGDGLIGVLQVAIVRKVLGPNAFKKWNWKALALMVAIGVGQNIPVTYIMRKEISVGKISWAPLMPFQTKNIIQIQEAWIIQPILMYILLVKFNKQIFG